MEAEPESRTRNDAHPRTLEQEEANPEREQETDPDENHAYQPVGNREIILGTRLQKPAGDEEKKNKRTQHHSTRSSRDEADRKNYIIQDDVEYADDAQLFM